MYLLYILIYVYLWNLFWLLVAYVILSYKGFFRLSVYIVTHKRSVICSFTTADFTGVRFASLIIFY